MKKNFLSLLLLAALGVAGWATIETFRLFEATQQLAASQVTEMHAAAKLASVKARSARNLATVDESGRGSSAK
jgi:hypothetical protein